MYVLYLCENFAFARRQQKTYLENVNVYVNWYTCLFGKFKYVRQVVYFDAASVVECTPVDVLQHTATRCNTLQHTVMQPVAASIVYLSKTHVCLYSLEVCVYTVYARMHVHL